MVEGLLQLGPVGALAALDLDVLRQQPAPARRDEARDGGLLRVHAESADALLVGGHAQVGNKAHYAKRYLNCFTL